ncbi:furin-like [Watersipora subatra]|uniref:furin-like n=1 Tax=Watersipora subatra TaxID=2589382 RepID=UPI00355C1D12
MFQYSHWNLGISYVLTFLVALLSISIHGEDLDEDSHYTNSWAVELHSDATHEDVTAFAHSHGFVNNGLILPNSKFYSFHHPRIAKRSAEHAEDHTNLLSSHVHVRSVEQQVAKKRVKRGHIPEPKMVFADQYWKDTWYLKRGIGSKSAFDMNVIPAWQKGYTGKNIVVTILDDGIERDHPDLQPNYDPQASTDINSNDDDPMPRYDMTNENRHGTRCAGEVAAVANNTRCSVGVAYDAKIGGIRMLDGSVTDSVEASSLSFNPQHIDIYSSSWGPDDNGRTVDGPGKLAKKAFVDGVEKGRGGKGNIYMWASGNGGMHYDSCACDGYTNSIYTLSVSSVSEHNYPPWYLEQCASTIASTYSSGASGSEKQIVTTDLRKSCTKTHTGTSASAPLAAGLVAVMLEANPKMTWRDVQYVTLASANPEPVLSQGGFQTNGVGRKYSHKFGYGLMDCAKMADTAKDWVTAPPQLIKHLPKEYPDKDLRSKYTQEIKVDKCSWGDNGCIRYLEHVQIVLNISSVRRGRLSVKLKSPAGTESTVLPTRSSDSSSAGFKEWPFMSVHFWGENPAGAWQLEVTNGDQAGKITYYQLVLYGVSANPFDKNRKQTLPVECHVTCATSSSLQLSCSGSGADQCKACKPDLYQQEDTNLCVESCEDGYYIQVDDDVHMCKRCFRQCKTCAGGGIDMCTSCTDDFLLDNEGHCVEECPSGYFANEQDRECVACKDNCTSCASLDTCLVCDDAFDLVGGECMQKCDSREYRDKNRQCISCEDELCVVCSAANECKACDPSYSLYMASCVKECPVHTYSVRTGRDSGQTICKNCHKTCATCNDEQDNNCLSCFDKYQLTSSHTCVSNKTCPFGQFRELSVGSCQPCHDSCNTCSDQTNLGCTSCKENSYLKDGSCVEDCGLGFFKFIDETDSHASCQQCHLSCANCTGFTNTSCLSCPDSAKLIEENGSCEPICPAGTYRKIYMDKRDSVTSSASEDGGDLYSVSTQTTVNTSGYACDRCPDECLTCSGPRVADCSTCHIDKALNHAGQCVSECEDGYFKKNVFLKGGESQYVCHICNSLCATCNDATSNACLSCPDSYVLFHNQCVKEPTCYQGQFYSSAEDECLSCHFSCHTCSGPSELECTACNQNHVLYISSSNNVGTTSSGQCVVCCDNGEMQPNICCDCSIPDSPRCNEGDRTSTTTSTVVPKSESSTRTLVFIAVIGIFASIALYIVVFVTLQYRSYGRCAWQTSSSTLLIDGGGIIEYSSLTDKDDNVHFSADDQMNVQYSKSKSKMLNDSD